MMSQILHSAPMNEFCVVKVFMTVVVPVINQFAEILLKRKQFDRYIHCSFSCVDSSFLRKFGKQQANAVKSGQTQFWRDPIINMDLQR